MKYIMRIYRDASNLTKKLLLVALVLATGWGPIPFLAPKLLSAAPPANGVYGFVIDIYESDVPGASIEITCSGSDNWTHLTYADEGGQYSATGANMGSEPMEFAGCGNGHEVYIRATASGYLDSEGQLIGTIDLQDSESFADWAARELSPAVQKGFVLDFSDTPEDGWYGVVQDNDSGDPIAGATLIVACSTQDSSRLLATTNEEGYYEASKLAFVSQLNSNACYYDEVFDVVVTISAEGYEDEVYTIQDVQSVDMGAPFEEPNEMNFYLYPEEVDPATYYAEGDGTENSPFIVDSQARLYAINYFPDYAEGLYFALGGDLVLTSEDNYVSTFTGLFDGRNHTITLYDNELFSELQEDATVKNLFIKGDFEYDYAEHELGLLAGMVRDDAYVENVHVIGSITLQCGLFGCSDIGGLVGEMRDSAYIYRSSAQVDIEGWGNSVYFVGGLVGFMVGGTIEQSYATGDIYATGSSGGLVGAMANAGGERLVTDSYATGSIYTRSDSSSGGFVGEISGSVLRSYSTGSVHASSSSAGGFAGYIGYADSFIANSFSAATTIEGDEGMGGFFGVQYEGDVHNSAWVIIPDTNAGGLIDESTTVCTTYGAKALLAGVGNCNYGTDLSSVQQLTKNGYNGAMAPVYLDGESSWDFNTIWGFDEDINNGLPYLRWGVEDDEEESNSGGSSSGGSSSGGSIGGSSVARVAANAGLSLNDLAAIIARIRALVAEHIAAGGTPTTDMLPFAAQSTDGVTVRDLEYGSQGDDVRLLQTLLMGQGHVIPAGATGLFFDQTQSALAAYQSAHGIVPAQGYFGSITRAFMKAAGLAGLWW